MTPQKAHKLGVDASKVRVTCESDKHGGDWIVWVPDERKPDGKDILTQGGAFYTFQWDSELKKIQGLL